MSEERSVLLDFFFKKTITFTFQMVVIGTSLVGTYYLIDRLSRNSRPDSNHKDKMQGEGLSKLSRHLKGAPLPVLNDYEEVLASSLVLPDDIDVTWDDVGGLESIKEQLYVSLIVPLNKPELYSKSRLVEPPKGALFFGPPGTGKTMMASAVAKRCGCAFLSVSISKLQSPYLGENQRYGRALFTLASKVSPCVIFIDEIDGMFPDRDSGMHEHTSNQQMKAEMLGLWDGMQSEPNSRVVVIACTNRPHRVDEAVLRRLPLQLFFDLPDADARLQILDHILEAETMDESFDLADIATRANGYSGSDLHEICKVANTFRVREMLAQGEDTQQPLRPLRHGDFVEAMRIVRPTAINIQQRTALSLYSQR